MDLIKVERPKSEFSDGPPCLESLTQSKLNDGRDRVIYQFIQYAKRKWPEEWPKKINQFNYTHFVEPLEDKVIQDNVMKNQCVIIVINHYVRLENLE